MKMNKNLMIGGVIGLVVIGGGAGLAYKLLHKSAAPATTTAQKKRITDPVNIVDQKDRPYIVLTPVDDHDVTLSVQAVKKPATTLDYLLEYQTDSSLQGLSDTLDISKVPAMTKPILFGTRSAGGATTYHNGITGGTLTAKFSGGQDGYALKQDWSYAINGIKTTKFSSADAFFQIDAPSLAKQRIVLIFNTPGYPGTPNGTVISEAYSLVGMNTLDGTGTLTMRAKEDATGAVIEGWNGFEWKEFSGTANGKSITAQVDLLPVYVVVKK